MAILKTIVAAVDGSEHAFKAIDLAAELAQKFDARLLVVSVFKRVSRLESTHSLVKSMQELGAAESVLRDIAREAVDTAVAHAQDRGARRVEGFIKEGQPARTIVDFAREHHADAIIMGSRGLGDIGSFLLGSVSHKVTSLAECTCFTVK